MFAVIVEDAHWPHTEMILTATYLTVGLSVMVARGFSAVPLVKSYASWYQRAARDGAPAAESAPAHEHRVRRAERSCRRRSVSRYSVRHL